MVRIHTDAKSPTRKKIVLAGSAIAALALPIVLGVLAVPCIQAQAPSTQPPAPQSLKQMEAAGIKMAFDVASVKLNKSGGREYSNVPLPPGDAPPPNGGLFSATNNQLISYIAFAYDLSIYELLHLQTQLPQWAIAEKFDIEARAPGNPTRDEMRLMMQTLLADRFKLTVHTETKRGPLYALMLSKPGKTGPHLRLDTSNEVCPDSKAPAPGPAGPDAEFPPICASGITPMQPTAPGEVRLGGRNMTIAQIADLFPLVNAKLNSGIDRPIVDQTGLTGKYDFAIEWTPEFNGPAPPNFQLDPSGPTLMEAMKDQLGLKLDPMTGTERVIVLDHVEEPSPN